MPWIDYCYDRGIKLFIKQLGTRWALDTKTVPVDAKGGNPTVWPEGLNVREHMPI
jgi:hypothetical protein